MPLADTFLPEFDREMLTTRSLLERVPDAKASWKPHEKARTLGELAIHTAALTNWGRLILTEREFDMNPPGLSGVERPDGDRYVPRQFESAAKTLELFDDGVRTVRGMLTTVTDGELQAMWALKNEGKTVFAMPRVSVLRSFFMNHSIHHRGQLSVYLRMCDVALPPLYGPTADSGS